VALFAVFAMCLLGMCALAIDVGTWYQDKRHLSADADAAALAGAAAIPTNSAIAAATANFTKNRLSPNEQVTVTTPAFDTVTVKTTYSAPTFFSKIFGKTSTTITATATARIRANGVAQHHVSPYVVTVQTYNNGQGTVLFSCDASGNCGTVDLPMADNTSGGSCSGNVYSGITGNVQGAITDTLDIGKLVVGGCLSPKTGNAQPSANAVNNLPGSFNQDLQYLGAAGQYQVSPQSWDDTQGLPPRLIYVPIVQSFAQGTNANMTILFFAWFYITGATGSGQGLHINGQYVSLSLPASSTTVDWVPGRVGQVTSVMLTA
jgi:Flp pilus assembly protein TadG